MSKHIPSYRDSDRWLENGIPLSGTKLNTELDNLAMAVNSLADSTANWTFEAGFGVRFHPTDKASGKWHIPVSETSYLGGAPGYTGTFTKGNDATTIRLGGTSSNPDFYPETHVLFPSDTDFTVFPLHPNSRGFGARWLHLGVSIFCVNDGINGGGTIHHPFRSGYSDANAFIIRDSADRNPQTEDVVNDGEHLFAIHPLVDLLYDAASGPYVLYSTVRIRNVNNSFAIRQGTGVSFGPATNESAPFLVARLIETEW